MIKNNLIECTFGSKIVSLNTRKKLSPPTFGEEIFLPEIFICAEQGGALCAGSALCAGCITATHTHTHKHTHTQSFHLLISIIP